MFLELNFHFMFSFEIDSFSNWRSLVQDSLCTLSFTVRVVRFTWRHCPPCRAWWLVEFDRGLQTPRWMFNYFPAEAEELWRRAFPEPHWRHSLERCCLHGTEASFDGAPTEHEETGRHNWYAGGVNLQCCSSTGVHWEELPRESTDRGATQLVRYRWAEHCHAGDNAIQLEFIYSRVHVSFSSFIVKVNTVGFS